MDIARVVVVLHTFSVSGHSVNLPHYSSTGETPVPPCPLGRIVLLVFAPRRLVHRVANSNLSIRECRMKLFGTGTSNPTAPNTQPLQPIHDVQFA